MPPQYSLLDQSLLESLGDDFQEYLNKQNKTTPRNSYIGSFIDAFKAGFANVIGGMADFTDANLGIGRGVGDYFNEVTEHNSRKKEYDLPDMIPFVSDFWTHPEGAAYTIGQTVGSSAAMLPVVAGVGYAVPSGAAATTAGLAARALGRVGASSMSRTMAGKTGEMIVRGTAGNIASAVPESMAEGGNVYREMTTGDTPFTDAQGVAAANEVTAKNIPLLMFANAIEAAVIGKALAKHTSLKPGDKLIKRIAKGAAPLAGVNAAQEGLTEFFQETISGEAKGEERGSLFDPSSWTKEQRMAFGEGVIGGGFLGGVPATVRSAFPVKGSQSTPHERTNDKVNNKKSGLDVPSEKYYNVTDEVSDARLAESTETKLNILSRDFERNFGQKLDVTSMRRNGDGSSWHDSGQAVDVVSDILKNDQEARTWLINRASELGLKGLDEYANPSAHATGGHLHFTDNGESLAERGRTNAEHDNINAAALDDELLQADFATPADFLNYKRDTSQNPKLVNLSCDALESGNKQTISDVAKELGYQEKTTKTVNEEGVNGVTVAPSDIGTNIAPQTEMVIPHGVNPKPVIENALSQQAINATSNIPNMPKMNISNQPAKGLTGHTVKVRTDDGADFDARYKAVPADSLISSHNDDHSINHNYPAELQPRNRERKAMQQQIADIVNGLRPADLAESRSINQGAPLVNADNIVENGNGRTLALRRMYRGKHENAPKYKQYLVDNAEKFGLNRAQVEAIPNPVLVRERASDIDVNKIINSTEGGARLAAGEQARVDAGRLRPNTLDLFVENDSGDLLTAANRDFTRAALSDIAHKNDINSLLDENGSISQAGVVRIKNALFAKAYGDNNLLAKMSESTDNNIRNITSGLLNAAPYVSTTKAKMAEGSLHTYDLTSDVVEATKKIAALRDEGKPVNVYLKEQFLFGADLSDNARDILQFLDNNKQKPKNIANLLKIVSKSVWELGSPDQGRLFDVKLPSLSEIFNEAMGAIINEGQQHIFAADRLRQGESGNDGTVQETTATLERPGARHRSGDGAGSEAGAGKHHEGRSDGLTQAEINALLGFTPERKKTRPQEKPGKIFDGERAEKALLARFGKKPQEKASPEKKRTFNLVKDDSDAALANSIKEVQAELSKLSANPMFNPKLMNAAFKVGAIYLQRGINNFADWSRAMVNALGDKIKPFLNSVWDSIHAYPENVKYDEQITTEVFEYVGSLYENGITDKETIRKKFIELAGEEYAGLVDSAYAGIIKYPGFERGENKNVVKTAVEHTQSDSPRDNQNPMGQDNSGEQPLAGGGQGVSPATESGVRTRGGERLPGRGADTGGEIGNRAVRQEIPGDKASPAGDIEHRRSGADSAARPRQLNDRPGSPAVEGTSGERPDNAAIKDIQRGESRKEILGAFQQETATDRQENKLNQQADHLAKIRESLPNLLPEQHGDVYFAEKRFSSPNGTGVLFTNGTGTGKTFSGLGIAKRFSLEGKNNILIAIPNDKIISDWIKAAAEKFDLGITQLANTKDNGKNGAVITTYANLGYNNELVKRNWDLIICDESHELMSGEKAAPTQALENLRALTYHDRGLHERFKRLHAKEYADLEALNDKQREAEAKATETKAPQDIKAAKDLSQECQKKYTALETKRTALVKEWQAVEKHNKPKVTFLSATPFAYVPTVDYAEGYLFEYNKSKDGGGYNVPDGREDFFVKNFGYRMRYNKLTRPDAEVNTSVMEVNFHNMLRKEGALSGRMLSIDKDYDRGFLLINDGIGNKVDEGFDWLFDHNNGEFRELYDFIRDNYKYHEKLYLLEAIKAKHSVDTIKEYLAQGKKVVIFHDYKKGGAQHPFRPQSIPKELREDYDRFAALRPDLIKLNLNKLKSPINTFKEAFGDSLLLFNGDVPSKIREKNVQLFNDDNSGKNIILVQSDAGQAGISLHDTTGKHQRVLFNLGMPTKPTAAIQIEGRIYRVGQKSNAMFRYLNTGTNMERFAFANKIAERVSTAENLALGDDARNLKESFISAFENTIGTDAWTDYLPGGKNEGTGGRETDRAARERLSDFDRAKAFYYGNMKRNSKTKSAEGIDYYATPEPLGLKMVEWANIKEGDKVMEPSAGHGAIARWFPANTENVFIEPSRELGAMAKMAGDGTLISNTFEDYYIGNKFNAIVMNPPFGTGGKTAMEHVAKAFKHLRDGGRIVALVPEGSSMEKRFNAWYESDDAKHAYLAGEISLPTATFERAGTSAKTKILLIDRHMSREGLDNLAPRQVDLSSVKDINELFDRIKDMRMPDRHRPGQDMETEADASAGKAANSAPSAADVGKNSTTNDGLFVTSEHIHTKTGVTNYTVNIREKLSDTEYKNVAAIAKKHAGYWNKFGKAFFFAEEGNRNRFVNEASPLLAGEKYSISDTEKPGGRKAEEWTSDIKRAFPTAERIERKGDTFTVDMPNRNVLTIKVGQDIQFTAEDRARAEYALKRPLKPTERPAGTYKHVSNIEGIISLADIADVHTLNHEAYHATRSLALTLTEQQLLDKYFGRNEEAQADGYAKWLQDREAYKGTVIRRFFQKILDLVNKVKAAFGFENVDNVFRKIAEGEIWNRNVKTETSLDIRTFNSLTDGEKAQVEKDSREFARQLDEWMQGQLRSSAMIGLGSTPEILVKLGAEKLPIQVSQRVIAKIINPAEVTGGKHGLSIEQLKKLPEQLHNPVMVFKSATKDNSMVVLTELVDSNGRSIIAAIHLNVEHRHHMINAIASVYSKDNIVNFVTNQINKDNLLYQNKEKSRDWFLSRGLQLPKEETAKHDSSSNSILPQNKNNVNSPDVTDLKYSIRAANNNIIEKLGKFIGEQPAKNVEVKITPNKERLTILESIARSPNAVAANHPVFRIFYKMATKASEVQEKLRDDFGRRLKRINEFVKESADKDVLQEVLWRGDMEGRNYTVQELKSEGVSENVIHAYVRTRSAIEKAYNLLNDARRQVRTHSKNMNAQEFSELKNNKFAEIIQVVPKENGNVLVTWKSPKTWEKDVIINEQTLELYRQDDAIQILEANQIAKTNALGEPEKQYQVRVRETITDIHKRGGYLPHFFHNYFIIGDGEVIGSGKTLADAVKKANKLTEQNPDMKIFIRPKEFEFEGQDVYAAVVGDEEYRRMAEKVAKDSEMTLAEARDYLSDKVKMKPRHRFFGNMLERKGVKGYEQENLNWVLNHYFNSVSRYVALEEFKPQSISLFERYFGRYDKEHTGLAAYAKDYINDINGNPTKLENVLNEALKSSELFRNVLGKYFGDRPALQVASMLTSSMTIAKLGFLAPSSALLNLTQLVNAGGVMGNPFALVNGIKRTMNLTATDKKILLKAGVLNNITFDSNAGYSRLKVGKLGRMSLYAFKKMDMFARISTVLGAYYQGVNEKGMTSQEALNYAKEVNRDANFDYGVQDAPNIFRRGSVLAQVALQFQKYPIKEFELMWKLYKHGNIKQNAAFWLPYILMAGLFQFPFFELFNEFFKIFDVDLKTDSKKVLFDWAGADKDKQALAKLAMYGLGSTIGIDASQRTGIADIVPTRMPKNLVEGVAKAAGPAGSTVHDLIAKMAQGDPVGIVKAYSPALGNYLQAFWGESTTTRGRTGTRYDTGYDRALRAIGFRSVDEAVTSDIRSIINRGRDEKTKLEQDAIDNYIDDPSSKNLTRLKELKITPQRVQNERQKKKMDNLERLKDGLGKKELPQYKNILDFAASK